jgi:FkbM family methyltransferase
MGRFSFADPLGYSIRYPDGDYIGARIEQLGMPYEALAMQAVKALLNASPCIVDVGANLGNHTLYWASQGARVWSYEPNPVALEYLVENVRDNGFDQRVVVRSVAVGERRGSARIARSAAGNLGATVVEPHTDGDLPVVRLDDEPLPAVDAVKIDVEGHELAVLRGATQLLARDQPVVMLEAWSRRERTAIDRNLRKVGYRRFPLRIGGGPTFLYLHGGRELLRAAATVPVISVALRVLAGRLRSAVRRRPRS